MNLIEGVLKTNSARLMGLEAGRPRVFVYWSVINSRKANAPTLR